MRITDLKLYVLEDRDRSEYLGTMARVPDAGRMQLAIRGLTMHRPAPQPFLQVITDEAITGKCDADEMSPRNLLKGSPFRNARLRSEWQPPQVCVGATDAWTMRSAGKSVQGSFLGTGSGSWGFPLCPDGPVLVADRQRQRPGRDVRLRPGRPQHSALDDQRGVDPARL